MPIKRQKDQKNKNILINSKKKKEKTSWVKPPVLPRGDLATHSASSETGHKQQVAAF
jgi:hypothetical protein